MIRRALAVGGVAMALFVLSAGFAVGAVDKGAQLATVTLTVPHGWAKPMKISLQDIALVHSDRDVLATSWVTLRHAPPGTPTLNDTLSWTPDGRRLAFAGIGKKDRMQIYFLRLDGSSPHPIPHTVGGFSPVLSSDGSKLAFARSRRWEHIDRHHPLKFRIYESMSTWVLDLRIGAIRRLTPWEDGVRYWPSSFAPDDSTILLSGQNNHGMSIAAVDSTGGQLSTLEPDAEQGVYSPDGSKIAFISYRDHIVVGRGEAAAAASELYSMESDGTDLKRLTHSRRASESTPNWDPSGQRLAFVSSAASSGLSSLFPFGNRLMEINADGTCSRPFLRNLKIRLRRPPAYYGAAWRPGPGREAGPISC